MTDDATRMRDAGRSWTEIAERLGVSVAEAKARVQEDKRARRDALSKTPLAEDRNGLRDPCADCAECPVPQRKSHKDLTGPCEHCACQEYVYHMRDLGLPWWRLPKTEDPHYVDPDIELSPRVNIQARQLGVVKKIGTRWKKQKGHPGVQQPKLETLARRARKKLKQGKKLKKHYDRPTGWQ